MWHTFYASTSLCCFKSFTTMCLQTASISWIIPDASSHDHDERHPDTTSLVTLSRFPAITPSSKSALILTPMHHTFKSYNGSSLSINCTNIAISAKREIANNELYFLHVK